MISALACVDQEARIADQVTIGPFTTIHKNVVIGENTSIGSNVVIMEGARIGKNCQIFSGAVIAAIPQDLKFAGEDTTVVIGDHTIIREYVTISRGTKDKYVTQIGSGCLLMAYVHIAHDCIIGNDCIFSNAVQMGGHVMVDDCVTIGGTAAIHQFVRIGKYAMIGGGSLVRKDIPPYIKSAREPMRYCGVNSIGLRRKGIKNEKINMIQKIYRYIFQKNMSYTAAIHYVSLHTPVSEERDEIINFIKNSERGILKNNGLL